MGWLRSVGSIKLYISFAEYRLFYRSLLQKRPIILSILLTKATPYASTTWFPCMRPRFRLLRFLALPLPLPLLFSLPRSFCHSLPLASSYLLPLYILDLNAQRYSVLQCVAVCCSVLQCVIVTSLLSDTVYCSVLQCVAVRCSVLQCVVV